MIGACKIVERCPQSFSHRIIQIASTFKQQVNNLQRSGSLAGKVHWGSSQPVLLALLVRGASHIQQSLHYFVFNFAKNRVRQTPCTFKRICTVLQERFQDMCRASFIQCTLQKFCPCNVDPLIRPNHILSRSPVLIPQHGANIVTT